MALEKILCGPALVFALLAVQLKIVPQFPQTISAKSRHVVVVGGGIAGLSAAIEAHKQGASVTLVEAEEKLGGNSITRTSGVSAVGSRWQDPIPAASDEELSPVIESFIEDILNTGGTSTDIDLAEQLAHRSASAIEFLEEHGVLLNSVYQAIGHSAARTHLPSGSSAREAVGSVIAKALEKYVRAQRDDATAPITIISAAKMTSFIILADTSPLRWLMRTLGAKLPPDMMSSSERIAGVRYVVQVPGAKPTQIPIAMDMIHTEVEIEADSVLLATGGYVVHNELLRSIAPAMANYSSTSMVGAQGEGLLIASSAGAHIIDLPNIEVHPTTVVSDGPAVKKRNDGSAVAIPVAEYYRVAGGVLLDSSGKRFTNELDPRDKLAEAMERHQPSSSGTAPMTLSTTAGQTQAVVYLVVSDDALGAFGGAVPRLDGLPTARSVNGFEGLAEAIGAEHAAVKQTLDEYNQAAAGGIKDAFGRALFGEPFGTEQRLWLVQVQPSRHYTMGGVRISLYTQVSRKTSSFVNGLFCAGEGAAGIHGSRRLAGNDLTASIVFGRIAGAQAANKPLATPQTMTHLQ